MLEKNVSRQIQTFESSVSRKAVSGSLTDFRGSARWVHAREFESSVSRKAVSGFAYLRDGELRTISV
jgi:hypothetical protein